jgi:hypothetical protein
VPSSHSVTATTVTSPATYFPFERTTFAQINHSGPDTSPDPRDSTSSIVDICQETPRCLPIFNISFTSTTWKHVCWFIRRVWPFLAFFRTQCSAPSCQQRRYAGFVHYLSPSATYHRVHRCVHVVSALFLLSSWFPNSVEQWKRSANSFTRNAVSTQRQISPIRNLPFPFSPYEPSLLSTTAYPNFACSSPLATSVGGMESMGQQSR